MTVRGHHSKGSTYRTAIEPEAFDPATYRWPAQLPSNPNVIRGTQLLSRISQENLAYLVARYPRGVAKAFRTDVVVNPESFSESVGPQYSRRAVLGLSHEVIQYIRTASRELSMQFWVSWDVYIQRGLATQEMHPVEFRDFMASLCVPAGARLSPPLVEVHWPGANLGFMGVVSSLNVDYTRFSSKGDPIEYTVDAVFVEVATTLMTSPNVKAVGMGSLAQKG